MSYGDVYVREVDNGQGSVDVEIDLGNGTSFKVFTDPDGSVTSFRSDHVSQRGTWAWSKP